MAKMARSDYSADFSLEWAVKDLDLALAAGGTDTTPVVMAIAERWRSLVAQGHGRSDISAARFGLSPGSTPPASPQAPPPTPKGRGDQLP
jgi:3-hydroxyisobutyrate dehydrogenase